MSAVLTDVWRIECAINAMCVCVVCLCVRVCVCACVCVRACPRVFALLPV